MGIEIRSPGEDELRAAMQAGEAAFGGEQREEEFERFSKMLPLDRWFAAYDGGRPVGTATSFPFRLTVPGGELAAGGVTWVGVLPSHRRRGILRELMKRQLEDLRDRGEPLAILYSSEPLIYGRFGYGVAAPSVEMDGETARFAYRDDPGPTGSVRIIDAEEALRVLPPVYDAVRGEVPGFVARDSEVWKLTRLADPEHWRRGAGPKFFAVIEFDGKPVGYAIYRSSLHLKVFEGLWLRFVDLEAALAGRTYVGDDAVVVDVRDAFCPWNAGRWRIGPTVERTDDEAELELDTTDLASAYLGAFTFNELGAAQRVRELKPGALQRATDLFRTSRPPYCPEDF